VKKICEDFNGATPCWHSCNKTCFSVISSYILLSIFVLFLYKKTKYRPEILLSVVWFSLIAMLVSVELGQDYERYIERTNFVKYLISCKREEGRSSVCITVEVCCVREFCTFIFWRKREKNTEKRKQKETVSIWAFVGSITSCCSERARSSRSSSNLGTKICLYLESYTGTDKFRRSGIWFNPHFCDRDQKWKWKMTLVRRPFDL